MKSTKWTIDETTELFRSDDGFRVKWAGCFFGPTATLEELVEAEFADRCRRLMDDSPGTPAEITTVDSVFGDGLTIEI